MTSADVNRTLDKLIGLHDSVYLPDDLDALANAPDLTERERRIAATLGTVLITCANALQVARAAHAWRTATSGEH